MSDTNVAPGGGADAIVPVPVATPAVADNSPISLAEAGRQLANFRWKRDNPEAAKAEETKAGAAEPAAAQPELAATPTDAQPQADPVVTQTEQQPEPATESPIEPPRSWTKEAKERWQSLPRDTQEYLAQREQDREREFRRSQNEAADARKAIEAERVSVNQARQQYEQALPALLQTLQEQQNGEFADIKTMADVEKLAREDWPRYALWDAQQKKIAAVSAEVRAAQDRQERDFRSKWSDYANKQDQLLIERVPELADKSRSGKVADSAVSVLRDIGFSDQELAPLWNGEASVSLRDHRLQLLILDAVKYREAKAAVAKPAPKPVPQVQRPGVSKAPVSADDAAVQEAQKAFDRDPSVKTAAALRLARQRVA